MRDDAIPEWADLTLSADLPKLRSAGESQQVEYMRSFPEQARDLAKEVAAFATSNAGMILIGVSDFGELLGLDEVHSVHGRDKYLARIQGICSRSIAPAVTPRVCWAVESQKVVLVLKIPKGTEPIYYCDGRPYLRHLTESRPAQPHEVVSLIQAHLSLAATDDQNFYSEVARVLVKILLWEELPWEEKLVKPWLEEWRSDYSWSAHELRALAVKDVAEQKSMRSRLRDLASALDEVVNFRLYMGAGPVLQELAATSVDKARGIKKEIIDEIQVSDKSIDEVRNLISETSRKLSDLADRAPQMVSTGRIEELKSTASEIGRLLLTLSLYNLKSFGANLLDDLREVGRRLYRLGAARVYADGGASVEKIMDDVKAADSQLTAAISHSQIKISDI